MTVENAYVSEQPLRCQSRSAGELCGHSTHSIGRSQLFIGAIKISSSSTRLTLQPKPTACDADDFSNHLETAFGTAFQWHTLHGADRRAKHYRIQPRKSLPSGRVDVSQFGMKQRDTVALLPQRVRS